MTILHRPPATHRCAPGVEARPCTAPTGDADRGGCSIPKPHQHLHRVGAFDPPGTVRQCGCGKTFVGYKLSYPGHPVGRRNLSTHWRPERWWQRRWRERRERRRDGGAAGA